MKIERISQQEIDKNSIENLSTRPNAPPAMGGSGLSSKDLKKRFDGLASLAIKKINDIIDAINAPGTSEKSIINLIQTGISKSEEEEYTLNELLYALVATGYASIVNIMHTNIKDEEDKEYTLYDLLYKLSQESLSSVEHVNHSDLDPSVRRIFEGGIEYYSELLFSFKDGGKLRFPNLTVIPLVAGNHTELRIDQDKEVAAINAKVDQHFKADSIDAQSGQAVAEAIQSHDTSKSAHPYLFDLFSEIEQKVNLFLTMSDEEKDEKLDQLGELVSYIRENRDVIQYLDETRIKIVDIVDNLESSATDKPLSAAKGKDLNQKINFVQSQVPLVLPYIFKWGKNAPITQGEINTVAAKYFNRIPKKGDHFFGYFYIEDDEDKEITHKDYHVSAIINEEVSPNVDPEEAIEFKVIEAVQFISTVDPHYSPDSPNAQSGQAVAEAVSGSLYVSLPSKINVKTNSELKVYFRNILSRNDAIFWLGTAWNDNLETRYYAEYFTVSASAEGNFNLPWKVFDQKYNLLARGTLTIVASAKAPSDETKVIVIGDSTVNDGTIVKKAVELYTGEGATLTSLGTRTSLGQKHEGRGGWTAKMYCTVESSVSGNETITNSFYNPQTKTFDFAYYMANQGYGGVQAVAIQLGINDIFSIKGGDVKTYDSSEILNYINQMVSSILAYDNSIKVIINLPTTPNSNGTSFTETYETTQIYWFYNHNIIRFAKDLKDYFANNPSVVVSASNCILDTKTQIRDGVHPTADGYNALGQRLYEVLSSVVDGTVISFLNVSSREYVQHQGNTIPPTGTRELDFGKCYEDTHSGSRSTGRVSSYLAISPTAFKVTMKSIYGAGVSFPVNLEAGKTYTLKYTFSHAGRCYVSRYNMDTTFHDYADTISLNAGSYERTITVEDGYIYVIVFAPWVTDTEVTVSDISLTEN